MNIIKVKEDPDTKEQYLDLNEILKNTNVKIEDVAYYEFEDAYDNQLVLTLYDKNKKKIKVDYK